MSAILGLLAFSTLHTNVSKAKHGFTVPPPLNVVCRLDSGNGARQDFVTFTVTYDDEGYGDGQWDECNNLCRGEVHNSHQACDLSCDIKCSEYHRADFYPDIDFDRSDEFEKILRAAAEKDSSPIDAGTVTDLMWHDAQKPFYNDQYERHVEWSHWNTKPCSYSYKGYSTHYVGVHVAYQFSHIDNRMGVVGGRVQGSSGTFEMADYEVPDFDSPFLENEDDCRCAPTRFTLNDWLRKTEQKYPSGLQYGGEFGGIKLSYTDLKKYDLKIQCPDMNSVQITARNPTPMPVNFTIWPGTMLQPNDPMTQSMLVTHKINLGIMSWGNLDIREPLSSFAEVMDDQQKGPVSTEPSSAVCINIAKHAPTPADSFRALGAPSAALRRLGTKASTERFIGPWTQARFWIASDAAKFDQVAERIMPHPTEGHYLRALHEVGTQAHLDFSKGPLNDCLDPKVILGGSATKSATKWFVQQMEKYGKKALTDWLKKNANKFASLWGEDAEEYEKKHIAHVATELCRSGSPEMRQAGYDLLLNTIPESFRPTLANAGGLNGIVDNLRSSDPAIVAKGLEVAEIYKDKHLVAGLMNMSPKVSDELRNKGQELAKVISK